MNVKVYVKHEHINYNISLYHYFVFFQLRFVDHEQQNTSVDSHLNQQMSTQEFPDL